jgi:hypothetical protein
MINNLKLPWNPYKIPAREIKKSDRCIECLTDNNGETICRRYRDKFCIYKRIKIFYRKMSKVISVFAIILILAVVYNLYQKYSWEIFATETHSNSQYYKPVDISQLLSNPDLYSGKKISIEGIITRESPNNDWFYLGVRNTSEIKVELSWSFFEIPPREGKIAHVHGVLVNEEGQWHIHPDRVMIKNR